MDKNKTNDFLKYKRQFFRKIFEHLKQIENIDTILKNKTKANKVKLWEEIFTVLNADFSNENHDEKRREAFLEIVTSKTIPDTITNFDPYYKLESSIITNFANYFAVSISYKMVEFLSRNYLNQKKQEAYVEYFSERSDLAEENDFKKYRAETKIEAKDKIKTEQEDKKRIKKFLQIDEQQVKEREKIDERMQISREVYHSFLKKEFKLSTIIFKHLTVIDYVAKEILSEDPLYIIFFIEKHNEEERRLKEKNFFEKCCKNRSTFDVHQLRLKTEFKKIILRGDFK